MSASLRSLSLLASASRSSALRPAAARVCLLAPTSFSSLAHAHKSKAAVAAPFSLRRTPIAALSTQSNAKVERPISPHVTVYDFPLPALSSITNRATAVGLSVGMMGMGLMALGGSCDIPATVESIKMSVPVLMPVIKMVVAFPIVYHTASGLRHLYWDKTAKGLDLASVELSSKVLIASSVVLSVGLGFYSLPALE